MLDFAEIKPSVLNLALITLMAVTGISLGKFALAKFYVPGLSELFGSI